MQVRFFKLGAVFNAIGDLSRLATVDGSGDEPFAFCSPAFASLRPCSASSDFRRALSVCYRGLCV